MATRKKQMHIYVQPDIFEILRDQAHESRTTASRIVELSIDELLRQHPGPALDEWLAEQVGVKS
jgi:flagellar biosynthesis/type III secretory pathway protein FliH